MSLLRQLINVWPEPDRFGAEVRSSAELFTRAGEGDVRALDILEKGSGALARCFAAVATLWDPEVLVVGGSVALGQPHWISESMQRARELCMAEVGAEISFKFASLGERSALVGAGLLVRTP
jgi:glucokinase